jgi:hypothetical protein
VKVRSEQEGAAILRKFDSGSIDSHNPVLIIARHGQALASSRIPPWSSFQIAAITAKSQNSLLLAIY